MSFISKIFGAGSGSGSGGRKNPAEIRVRVAELEAQAARERPGYQGMPLNRAGDLCLEIEDTEAALGFYGRAINALLDDQQREAARGVANKIIRIHPGAVRTLCTLTWLDLASHHLASALLHLRDYVAGVERVGTQDIARDHIMEMASVIPEAEFLDAVADALDRMGSPDEAAQVREWVSEGGAPGALREAEELASYCVSAAAGSNRRPPE
jgi:hypothetical protein